MQRRPKTPLRVHNARQRRKPVWARADVLVVALVLFLTVGPAVGDAINGFIKNTDGCRVIGIIDGDTVRLLCPVSGVKTGRILAYDTPEKRGQCLRETLDAYRATMRLRWILWTGSSISARTEGQDRYGRSLTLLLVDGKGVAPELIEAGLARWYSGGTRDTWCGAGLWGFDV